MNSRILQFIKKLQLAIRLAKADSLFVVQDLRSFAWQLPIAQKFVKKINLPPAQRLLTFLQIENDPILYILADEVMIRRDSIFNLRPEVEEMLPSKSIIQTSINLQDAQFYLNLVAEIISSDFPKLAEQYTSFKTRIDLLSDMRIHGSALEQLNPLVEIDWYATTKNQLCLLLPQGSVYTTTLSAEVQSELVHTLAEKFYRDSLFISSFYGVIKKPDNQILLSNFDALYAVDVTLRNYANDYLQKRALPNTLAEYKLRHLFLLLDAYCSDINWRELWSEHISNPNEEIVQLPSNTLPLLRQQGLDLINSQSLVEANPKALAYLLDISRHFKDSRFKKSSIFYFGPLIVVIYILIRYFN